MALIGVFGTPSFTVSTSVLNSAYRVTRINPNSIRDILTSIDEGAKSIPYPKRNDAQWWMIWDGDDPVAYVVGAAWKLDQAYAICHYSCAPEHVQVDAWVPLLEAVMEYAQEEGHLRTFVLSRDSSLQDSLVRTGFRKVDPDGVSCRYSIWES